MIVCNKCHLEKPESEYFVETKKDTGKKYRKKYCNDCFRKQAREWKRVNRVSQKRKDNPNNKQCTICNEWKNKDEYYQHKSKKHFIYKHCKECQLKREQIKRETHLENTGGNQRIKVKPNDYMDKYQKEQTFAVMKAFGWIFNEETGKWHKPGVRGEDGIFERMRNLPDDKVFVSQPGKRSGSKLITHKDYKLIVKLKAQGKTFDEISAITKLSKATIYKWIHADIKNR